MNEKERRRLSLDCNFGENMNVLGGGDTVQMFSHLL